MQNPLEVIRESIKHVPAMKYVLAVVALAAAAGIIKSEGDLKVTVVGLGIVVIFAFILLLFSRAYSSQEKKRAVAAVTGGNKGLQGLDKAVEDGDSDDGDDGGGGDGGGRGLSGPMNFLTWGIAIIFVSAAGLFVSCVFFKAPASINEIWGGGSAIADSKQARDFTLYLQDKKNQLPVDLEDGSLLLRVNGNGDISFDRAPDGTYRFRPFTSAEDSGILLLKGEQEWMFASHEFQEKITLKDKNVTVYVTRNPAKLILTGVIKRKGQRLAGAIISMRSDGRTVIDTTNAMGEFELRLPETSREKSFSIEVSFKVSKKSFVETFTSSAGKDIEYQTIH